MNTPTLSQLADIGAKAAQRIHSCREYVSVNPALGSYAIDAKGREAFAKAVLDAVGYKFPVDPEREAFERWLARQGADNKPDLFSVWQAGKASHTTTEPAKPQSETFEAHGHTWFKHTPGDPMPCEGNRKVNWLLSRETDEGSYLHWSKFAKDVAWRDPNFDIIGWRYADS